LQFLHSEKIKSFLSWNYTLFDKKPGVAYLPALRTALTSQLGMERRPLETVTITSHQHFLCIIFTWDPCGLIIPLFPLTSSSSRRGNSSAIFERVTGNGEKLSGRKVEFGCFFLFPGRRARRLHRPNSRRVKHYETADDIPHWPPPSLPRRELYPEDPLWKATSITWVTGKPPPIRVSSATRELFEVCTPLIFDDYPKNLEGASPEELSYLVAAALPMDLLWSSKSSNFGRRRTAKSAW